MNIFQIAAAKQAQFNAQVSETGYHAFTTFYSDLTIAELVEGAKGVKGTFNDVVKSWLDDYKYFTEFVMSLNYKAWEHANTNQRLSELYSDLYYKADEMFYEHYAENEEAKDYYFNVTD